MEEVRRDDPLGLRGQKLPPRQAASTRRRIDARAVQDLPDRRGAQAMTKPNQLAMDPVPLEKSSLLVRQLVCTR
ncbi:hypothetical protein [Lentzea sp. NPDC092896]|uniref:hypothetical protein n=1 Tax=Lentzea sp. NPDC092896 TaxID=3364127 RepID=UPI0038004AA8